MTKESLLGDARVESFISSTTTRSTHPIHVDLFTKCIDYLLERLMSREFYEGTKPKLLLKKKKTGEIPKIGRKTRLLLKATAPIIEK